MLHRTLDFSKSLSIGSPVIFYKGVHIYEGHFYDMN